MRNWRYNPATLLCPHGTQLTGLKVGRQPVRARCLIPCSSLSTRFEVNLQQQLSLTVPFSILLGIPTALRGPCGCSKKPHESLNKQGLSASFLLPTLKEKGKIRGGEAGYFVSWQRVPFSCQRRQTPVT